MPGDGLAGSEEVARFAIELKGFLNVLPSTHRWQFCFSELESPKVRKSQHPLPQWGMQPTVCRGANP
jgi:hypothetical protein